MLKIVEVKGKDAAEFLHRLTAGKVRGVEPGHGARGLLLTGQARMLAQFDLLHVEAGRFLLVAPAACAGALATNLENLHFAEDLSIATLPGDACYHRVPSSRGDESVFAISGAGEDVGWPSAVPGWAGRSCEGKEPGFDFDRIAALFPWPGDWEESTSALEAGTLPWIDRYKGCYPGQEVVEKSLNVGHPARVLQAYAATAFEAPGRVAFAAGGEAVLTSSARHDGELRALFRVPWARRADELPGFRRIATHW